MSALVLTSRRVVLPDGVRPASIAIENGCIIGIDDNPSAAVGHLEIDLGDLVVMPGVIDAHVHVNEPGRTEWEGFRTAGRSAAAGGVTTIIVMPLNCTPAATTPAALLGEAGAAAGHCLVDHGFWGGIVPGNTAHIEPMWRAGALGFKSFMVDSGVPDFPGSSRADLDAAMPVAAQLGAPVLVHAGDPSVIAAAAERSGLASNPRSYRAYLASRPPEAEDRAIETMIDLCRRHRARTHIVHVASASALPPLLAARAEGLPITAETCPHYLALNAELIPDGATQFKCAPPIRDQSTRETLWKALRDGVLDLIASDHSPCPPALKLIGQGDFARAWGGISSLQLTLSLAWTFGAPEGIWLVRLAELLSSAPAKLAGIDGFKGRISPGFDADLVVFDPEARWTVRGRELRHRHPVTPYEGCELRGRVMATYLRGTLVFASDESGIVPPGPDGLATEAIGRWVKRKPDDRPGRN